MIKFTTVFFLLTALACNDYKSDDKGKGRAVTTVTPNNSSAPKTPNSANSTNTANGTNPGNTTDSGKGLNVFLMFQDGTCNNIIAPVGKSLADIKVDAEGDVVVGSCPANTQVGGQTATFFKKCDFVPLKVKDATYSIQFVLYSKNKAEDGQITEMTEAGAVAVCKAVSDEAGVASTPSTDPSADPKSTQFHSHYGGGICAELVYGTAVSEKQILSAAAPGQTVGTGLCPASMKVLGEDAAVFKKCGVKNGATGDFTSQTVLYSRFTGADGRLVEMNDVFADVFCS